MPVTPTYPGVYVEEIPSGVRTITGVSTSVTAFMGVASRGPTDKAVRILSFTDYEDVFGGLEENSTMSYAVQHFFLNGGGEALVIRVVGDNTTNATLNLTKDANGLVLNARSGGEWGDNLRATVDFNTRDKAFNKSAFSTASEKSVEALALAETAIGELEKQVEAKKAVEEADQNSKAKAVKVWRAAKNKSDGAIAKAKNAAMAASGLANAAKEIAGKTKDPDLKKEQEAAADEAKDSAEKTLNAMDKAKPDSIAAAKADIAAAKTAATESTSKAKDLAAKTPAKLFNLTILELQETENFLGKKVVRTVRSEKFQNLPIPESELEGKELMEGRLRDSQLVRYKSGWKVSETTEPAVASGGANGDSPSPAHAKEKLDLLDDVDLFNLLCIPSFTRGESLVGDTDGNALLAAAATSCEKNRAILLVDPPKAWHDAKTAKENSSEIDLFRSKNAACYFPNVKMADPLRDGTLQEFAPCGVVSGMIARTDVTRGVWKAPAGQDDGKLRGVQELATKMSDGENGLLNPLGINCLRSFPIIGNVAWGARTLVGADLLANEWKYLPVRRLALFLEESLYRGTHWAVFEPNDEPLWAQLRLNVGAFMQNLFRQGAFQGQSPKEAYLVKVDKETTTQNDVNQGIVNIHVGFAPLKPAEFVILKFQQLAGQIDT